MWFSSKAKKNASFIREKWSRMTISWPQIPEIDCKCSQWIVPAQRFTIQNESSHPAFLSNVLCPVMVFTTPPQLIASPPFQEPLCHPSARGPCHHLWAWPGASSDVLHVWHHWHATFKGSMEKMASALSSAVFRKRATKKPCRSTAKRKGNGIKTCQNQDEKMKPIR